MNLIKLTLATLIFVMSFAIQSNEAEAQCPYDFIYGGTAQITLSPDCYMEVEYCYRIFNPGPDEDYDLYIGSVAFVGDCDQYRFAFDTNPSEYFQRAWEYIAFILNPWNTTMPPPCPTQSNEYWRLGHPSCYSSNWMIIWVPDDPQDPEGPLGHFKWVKEPCIQGEDYNFCWQIFTVCMKFENGVPVPEVTLSDWDYGDPDCSANCEFICE